MVWQKRRCLFHEVGSAAVRSSDLLERASIGFPMRYHPYMGEASEALEPVSLLEQLEDPAHQPRTRVRR